MNTQAAAGRAENYIQQNRYNNLRKLATETGEGGVLINQSKTD